MGFLDLSQSHREASFHQMDGCLIPGYPMECKFPCHGEARRVYLPKYTGYCPMLKFRFGKSYGAHTRDIIQELQDPGPIVKYGRGEPSYLSDVRAASAEGAGASRRHGYYDDAAVAGDLGASQRARPFILGYTGFIPGMSFRYGTSFGRAADATLSMIQARMTERSARRATERAAQARPGPPQLSIRGRDVVPESIAQAEHPSLKDQDRYKDSHISAALPPIAGYTGHIPRLKGTEASLSQRYHTSVTRGLHLLQQERALRAQQDAAQRATRSVLASAGPRYSIPAAAC